MLCAVLPNTEIKKKAATLDRAEASPLLRIGSSTPAAPETVETSQTDAIAVSKKTINKRPTLPASSESFSSTPESPSSRSVSSQEAAASIEDAQGTPPPNRFSPKPPTIMAPVPPALPAPPDTVDTSQTDAIAASRGTKKKPTVLRDLPPKKAAKPLETVNPMISTSQTSQSPKDRKGFFRSLRDIFKRSPDPVAQERERREAFLSGKRFSKSQSPQVNPAYAAKHKPQTKTSTVNPLIKHR